jgi:hypothetical protein
MDFDIVQILMSASVDIQGKPPIIHVRHYGSPTVTDITLKLIAALADSNACSRKSTLAQY